MKNHRNEALFQFITLIMAAATLYFLVLVTPGLWAEMVQIIKSHSQEITSAAAWYAAY